MLLFRSISLSRVLTLLAALLVLKVTASVVLNYGDYWPPNFNDDFLRGREAYFFGSYRWAFYSHLVSGPIALVLGLMLVSDRFRLRYPRWHRRLGRVQVLVVLLLVAPSGLWMARHAMAGPVAGLGFATLALATAACIALGWRTAVKRQFAAHRRWMWRSFVLLSSAVVIRVIGGLATVTGIHATWSDAAIAWGCWLLPLVAYELGRKSFEL